MIFELKELGQICEISSSKRIMRSEYVLDGIPFYRSKEIIELSQGLSISTDLYISAEQYNKIKDKFGVPRVGDILLTSVGTLGISYQIDKETAFYFKDGNLTWFKNFNKEIQPKYVYAWLKSYDAQQKLKEVSIGTTQKALTIQALKKVSLHIPPINVQNKISKIYFDLDDKIQLNKQINQTLESIAQAMFKSWFIDFEPVKAKIQAKLEGKDIELAAMSALSGKNAAELQQIEEYDFTELQAIAALFPDELVESELGEVPRGWELEQIKDIAKYCTNKISLKDLTLENYISTENMLPEKKGIEKASSLPKVNSVPAFRKGNILVSNIRPYFKKIWFSSFDGGHSNDVLNFEVLEKETEEYLYNLIYQDSFFDQMMASSKGSKMPRGDKKAIMDFQIVTPSLTLRKIYSEKIRKFYSKKNTIEIENRILINLRDTLLPKLLSGELEVLI